MERTEIILFLILVTAILLFLIGGIIYFIMQYRKRRILYEMEIRSNEERHRMELLKTQVESQEQTMRFIGQEIHDSVTQKLTLASLYLNMTHLESRAENHESIQRIIQNVLDELRQLSHALTNEHMMRVSLAELIRQETQVIGTSGLLQFELMLDDSVLVNVHSKHALIRVVQEFIQNTLKHAHASQIKISLYSKSQVLYLELEDNGIGFQEEKAKGTGMGLSNTTRRIASIQGKSRYMMAGDTGTRLMIEIPIH